MNRFYVGLKIILSSLFISFIPFAILISKFGLKNEFYLIILFGLIIGIFWTRKVIVKNHMEDYEEGTLEKTPDIIETWEKNRK